MYRYSQFSSYRTNFDAQPGGRGGKAWPRPRPTLTPEAPPPRPGATPSRCRAAQRPHLARRSARCSLLSPFLVESAEVLAPLTHGWTWLVASLCPLSLPLLLPQVFAALVDGAVSR